MTRLLPTHDTAGALSLVMRYPRLSKLWWVAAVLFGFVAAAIGVRIAYGERLRTDPTAFLYAEPIVQTGTPEHPSRRLVVIVHGMEGGRESMGHVRSAVEEALPGAHVLLPEFPASRFSNEDPLVIVQRLLDAVDDADQRYSYDEIVLIGFSLGAPIVRKALVCALTGCQEDYGVTARTRPWAAKVDRLILLAGMNRGWATHCEKVVALRESSRGGKAARKESDCRADRMRPAQFLFAEIGQRLAAPLGVGRLIMTMRRGEPFIANLRLEWLDLERSGRRLPPVVQLLGDIDDLVSHDDNVDRHVTGSFTFLTLKDTTHAAAIDMPPGHQRRRQLTRALTTPSEQLLSINELMPDARLRKEPHIKHVVFIMHGIRDEGDWAIELGSEFERRNETVRAFYRSYGYFPALYFLMRHRMEANVRWFVDQYTEVKSLYPAADKISFVGHSNGTYMLANALSEYHAVRFHRIVFAGSVVPTTFQWSAYRHRFSALRNYRGADDFVIAALPSVFEHFPRILNVGAAGFAGFDDELGRQEQSEYLVVGGHDAAVRSDNFGAIANYVLEEGGCVPRRPCDAYAVPEPRRATEHRRLENLVFRFNLAWWALMLACIIGPTYAVIRLSSRVTTSRVRAVLAGMAVVVFVLFVLRYV